MKLMIPVMAVMMVLFGFGVMSNRGASGNRSMGGHCMGGHDAHSSRTHEQHVASGASQGAVTSEAYCKAIPADMVVTTAREVLTDPQAWEGRDVLVAGKITSECPSGGWIWVRDETGDIHVDMHQSKVFIPQRVGSKVRAMGKVVLESGQPHVVGYGLQL